MKLIIVSGGIAKCVLNEQLELFRMLQILEDLYTLIPEASLYVDVGNGAQFIDPHRIRIALNDIQSDAFTTLEDRNV